MLGASAARSGNAIPDGWGSLSFCFILLAARSGDMANLCFSLVLDPASWPSTGSSKGKNSKLACRQISRFPFLSQFPVPLRKSLPVGLRSLTSNLSICSPSKLPICFPLRLKLKHSAGNVLQIRILRRPFAVLGLMGGPSLLGLIPNLRIAVVGCACPAFSAARMY